MTRIAQIRGSARALALWLAAVLIVFGCQTTSREEDLKPVGPVAQIAAGQAATGAWVAEVHRTNGDLICMNFVWIDVDGSGPRGDGSCVETVGPFSTNDGITTWVFGGTDEALGTSALIHLDGRPPVELELVTPQAGVIEGWTFYAASIAGGQAVTSIDVLDANGDILDVQGMP